VGKIRYETSKKQIFLEAYQSSKCMREENKESQWYDRQSTDPERRRDFAGLAGFPAASPENDMENYDPEFCCCMSICTEVSGK